MLQWGPHLHSVNKFCHQTSVLPLVLLCTCADGLYGEYGEGLFGQENGWSGAPLLSKASMSLKKTKAAILTDDEVDDYDWTCQGCLVWPLLAAAVIVWVYGDVLSCCWDTDAATCISLPLLLAGDRLGWAGLCWAVLC